jgi:Zn-dependent protease with chaperone function
MPHNAENFQLASRLWLEYYCNMERMRSFPGISPSAWEHPADSAALAAFSSIPFAGELVRRALGPTTERSLRLATLANSARASDSQFPSLYASLKDCAERLDIAPAPELYVRLDPVPGANSFGVEKPFIVLTSAALDLWSEDELFCILAHEVGHILSGHAVYKTLLAFLVNGSSLIAGENPLGGLAISALSQALKEWDRKSELSADRASLLVVQDASIAFHALMKAAAGPRLAQMDLNEFFRQARDYEAGQGGLDSLLKFVDVLGESHPFPIARITALQEWERSSVYAAILSGDYPHRGSEGERDAKRDFEKARDSYSGDFSGSEDPLSKAAGKVMDAMNGLFNQAGGQAGPGPGKGKGPSIEDVIDEIFGSKR